MTPDRRDDQSGRGRKPSSGGSSGKPARPARPSSGSARRTDRTSSDRTSSARKPSDRTSSDRKPSDRTSSDRKPSDRAGADRSGRPSGDRRDRSGGSRDSGRGGGRDAPWSRDRRAAQPEKIERTESQAAYDGPPIPEDITGRELDRNAANQLKSLPEKLASRVARHLVAAARLLHSDPETAYAHTVAARGRAARVAVVREASGEAAYAAGRFKDALAEFKAARRMSGDALYLPMMADCERALGRPDRALALARDAAVDKLDDAGRVELLIVASGARRDQGDIAAALRTLEVPELRSRSRASWSPRIRYAYADALLADGQSVAAREWFERAAGLDPDGLTDAVERVAALERLERS